MTRWWPVLLLVMAGCDLLGESAVTITEAEAAEIVAQNLTPLGYAPTARDHAISGLEVCDSKTGGCEVVAFTLDGWDAAHRVGFEYLADGDPELATVTGASYAFWPDALQDAVKTQLQGDVILVLRQVSHETHELAVGQLDSLVKSRLAEYGLSK